MINKILVEACVKAFKNIFEREGVPYVIQDDEEASYFFHLWEDTDEEKDLAYRQAAPAMERIASHEPFIFETEGEPLKIRLNYLDRKLERDSFGEIMFERPDLDWRFAISVKNDYDIIPREKLKTLFDKFTRVDDKTTRTTRGTGLGLYIVKGLVEAMGGEIRLYSNEECGFCAKVYMPVSEEI